MESFVITKILTKMDKLLISKILSHHFQIPFSEITMMNKKLDAKDFKFEDYVEDLEDGRSTTIKKFGGLNRFQWNIEQNKNVFMTPNFIQNYDFNGGYDEVILNSKVSYASN